MRTLMKWLGGLLTITILTGANRASAQKVGYVDSKIILEKYKETQDAQTVTNKINAAIKKIGTDERLDYIFDVVNGNILYVSPYQPNLTDKVLEELNKAVTTTRPSIMPKPAESGTTTQQSEKRISASTKSEFVGYNTPLTQRVFDVSGLERWADSMGVTKIGSKVEIDSLGIVRLSKELKSPERELRIQSAYLLGKAGEKAKSATAVFVHSLKDKEYIVRANTAWALGQILGKPKLVVPALITALNDTSPDVRLNAAAALYRFSSSASSAILSLKKLLKDEYAMVRLNAEIALAEIEEKKKNTQEKK